MLLVGVYKNVSTEQARTVPTKIEETMRSLAAERIHANVYRKGRLWSATGLFVQIRLFSNKVLSKAKRVIEF